MTYGALATLGLRRRRPAAAPPGARGAAATRRWTGAAGWPCGAGGTCGTTWVGADRDGWAAGRGFVNGSFISTASLPARAAAQRRAAAVSAPGRATPAAGAPRCVRPALQQPGVLAHQHVDGLDRRPHARCRARRQGSAPSGESAASRTRWRPLRETACGDRTRPPAPAGCRSCAPPRSGTAPAPHRSPGPPAATRWPRGRRPSAPRRRARGPGRPSGWPPASRPRPARRACGSVAIASGTSSTQAVPTLATTSTAGDIRRVDHRVSQAAAITTADDHERQDDEQAPVRPRVVGGDARARPA